MPKSDLQVRINAQAGSIQPAGGTLIIQGGDLGGGDPSEIGGWHFGPTTLSKNGVTLNSDGWIQVGIDARSVRLDAKDETYRLWAGALLGADAPFSVDQLGVLRATGAIISGDVTAETGHIGGFEIGSDYIRDTNDSMGLVSTVTAGDDVRFWAGAALADRALAPFRVTEAGVMTAKAGELGTLDVTGALTLIDPAVIKSNNYVTGAKGWQIDANGDAELWNVKVRGELRSAVLVYEETGVLGGDLVLAKSAGTLKLDYTVGDTMTVDGNDWRFATGDILHVQAWNVDGTILGDTWLTATRTANVNEYTTTYQSGLTGLTYPAGTAVADYGVSGQGLVYMTSRAPLGPSVSIQSHAGSPWSTVTDHARLGNLRNSFGVGDVYTMGIALGDYNSGQYIRWDGADLRVSGKVYVYPGSTKTLADWTHPSDHTLIDGGNIYANTVTVTASKVTLPGSTGKTLADWAHPSDTTLIDGGDIYANSITASKITMRGNNYLGNPNFETGDLRDWSVWPGRNIYVSSNGGGPYSGGYCCHVEGSGTDTPALTSGRVPTGPGSRWFGAAWLRGLVGTGTVAVQLIWYKATGEYLSHIEKTLAVTGTWTRVVIEGVAPTDARYVTLQVATTASLATGEWIGIDSCELIKSDVSVNITDDIKLNLEGLHLLDVSIWTGWGLDSKSFSLYTSYESGHSHTVSFSISGHRIKINGVWHIAIAM